MVETTHDRTELKFDESFILTFLGISPLKNCFNNRNYEGNKMNTITTNDNFHFKKLS